MSESILKTQSFLDKFNENELTRKQQKYRNCANRKCTNKTEQNEINATEKNLQIHSQELYQINACLSVAMATTHVQQYEKNMKQLEQHCDAQEQIQNQLNAVKMEIKHINMQLKRIDRHRIKVAAKAVSDHAYATKLVKSQKNYERFEDRLDASKKQEQMLITKNVHFKSIIDTLLHDRALFNKLWKKMIDQLSHNKKFLIDRIEGAVLAFNKGADLCHKLESLREKGVRDKKMDVIKMRDMVRQLDANEKMSEFLGNKGNRRELNDLEEREYKRRKIFCDQHNRTTEMYVDILQKVNDYYGVRHIQAAGEKFHQRDHEYFGHFNYMNDLNDKIEYLNASLSTIHRSINEHRKKNDMDANDRQKKLMALTDAYSSSQSTSQQVNFELEESKIELNSYFESIGELFQILRCDAAKLNAKLGDNSKVTQFNVNQYLSILEKRLNDVLNYVYYAQEPNSDRNKLIVRSVAKKKIEPTHIEEIVLLQQCAECAEGEDVNRYDEEIVLPLEKNEIRKKVRVKVQAPEMQYRLHNISKCVLPRSKQLVNKRYQ